MAWTGRVEGEQEFRVGGEVLNWALLQSLWLVPAAGRGQQCCKGSLKAFHSFGQPELGGEKNLALQFKFIIFTLFPILIFLFFLLYCFFYSFSSPKECVGKIFSIRAHCCVLVFQKMTWLGVVRLVPVCFTPPCPFWASDLFPGCPDFRRDELHPYARKSPCAWGVDLWNTVLVLEL